MLLHLVILLPILITAIWAIVSKVRVKAWHDVAELLITVVAGLLNAVLIAAWYENGELTTPLLMLRQICVVLFVPICYVYFARQITINSFDLVVITLLWACLLLFTLPGGVVNLSSETLLDEDFKLWTYTIITDDDVYKIEVCSIILILQLIVAAISYMDIIRLFRKYRLRARGNVQIYMIWVAAMICFLLSMTIRGYIYEHGRMWLFFALYSLLFSYIFALLARNVDLRPYLQPIVEEEESKSPNSEISLLNNPPVNAENLINQSRQMAAHVRKLLNEDCVWKQAGYTSKDAIANIGTNRTYFARMMQAEFGCNFSDLILKKRMNEARRLLLTTELTVAEVAALSGFGDSSTLTLRFKEIEHTTPAKWRKEKTE